MDILPINSLSETDQLLVDPHLINLAKLSRSGLPVPEGIVIIASDCNILINTLPEQLETHLNNRKRYYIPSINIDANSGQVKGFWTNDNKLLWKQIVFEGSQQLNNPYNSSSLVVLFLDKPSTEVWAYLDPEKKDTVISSSTRLLPKQMEEINRLVLLTNKKLLISQMLHLVIVGNEAPRANARGIFSSYRRNPPKEDKIYLIGLKPYTNSIPELALSHLNICNTNQTKSVKSAVKVFLSLQSGFSIYQEVDGVIVQDDNSISSDELILRLVEAALSFPNKPVIYKLHDFKIGVNGNLRLLNNRKFINNTAQIYHFIRNKKGLINLELGLPTLKSGDELAALKKELASLGVDRKGTSKFWLEMSIPENIINIDNYLEIGIDGIIFDLDKLHKGIGGYLTMEDDYYVKDVRTLIKFIEPALKILNKNKIPLLVKGSLTMHPDVLDLLVKSGVWGVISPNIQETESLPNLLRLTEYRLVSRLG